MKNKKSTWGGARAGAGRPNQGKKIYSITLKPATADRLRAFGDGNLSAGVEKIAGNIKP